MIILEDRERNLRAEVTKLEQHRKLIKNRRLALDIPTIAVVGYTNAGKTSLIKVLTKDASLKPKDQLFATLGKLDSLLFCSSLIIFSRVLWKM